MSFSDELWELSKELDNPGYASSQSKPFLFNYVRSGSSHTSFMEVTTPYGEYKLIPDLECFCPRLNDVTFSLLELAIQYAGNIETYNSVVEAMQAYLTGMKLDVTECVYDQDGNFTADSKHIMEFIVTSIVNPILCSGIQGSGKKVMLEGMSAGQPKKHMVFSPPEDLCPPEELVKLNERCKAPNTSIHVDTTISPLDKLRTTLEAMGCTLAADEAVIPTNKDKDHEPMVKSLSEDHQEPDVALMEGEFATDEVAEQMIKLTGATSLPMTTGRTNIKPPAHMSDRLVKLYGSPKSTIPLDFGQEQPLIGSHLSEKEILSKIYECPIPSQDEMIKSLMNSHESLLTDVMDDVEKRKSLLNSARGSYLIVRYGIDKGFIPDTLSAIDPNTFYDGVHKLALDALKAYDESKKK